MSEQKINHIAFIPSGNRRWAEKNGVKKNVHIPGVENFKKVSELCFGRGIKFVSFWAMSTENLKRRPGPELDALFNLVLTYDKYLKDVIKNKIRVFVVGDLEKLPKPVKKKCFEVMKKTENFSKGNLVLFFNYGGRDEILRAIRKLIKEKINPDEINEDLFKNFLDTKNIPDPDLVVRTGAGNEQRLSGFLPWQSVYSELFFSRTFWPDYNDTDLDEAFKFFENSKRNFGK